MIRIDNKDSTPLIAPPLVHLLLALHVKLKV